MSSNYSIHRATIEDIPIVQGIADVVFRRTYADILSPEQMEYMGDVPAGYVSFEADGRTEDGRKLFHLQKLYVLPEYQRTGLGRQMLEFVKGLLSEWNPEGCRIELNVNRGNPAVGFYEHIGMICDRQGDFPIGKGFYMNDFIYALDI